MAVEKRTRRSEEDLIAVLESMIAALQVRAVHERAKGDPSLRRVSRGVRAIDKALGAAVDLPTRRRSSRCGRGWRRVRRCRRAQRTRPPAGAAAVLPRLQAWTSRPSSRTFRLTVP